MIEVIKYQCSYCLEEFGLADDAIRHEHGCAWRKYLRATADTRVRPRMYDNVRDVIQRIAALREEEISSLLAVFGVDGMPPIAKGDEHE